MKKELLHSVPGKLVNVNGHEMHVFWEGNGGKTLVFMAGSGTCCPTLDFKPLWSLLTKRHRIVVIEKVTQLGEVTLRGFDLSDCEEVICLKM